MFELGLLAVTPTLAPTFQGGPSRLAGRTLHLVDGKVQLKKAWDYYKCLQDILCNDSAWTEGASANGPRKTLLDQAKDALKQLEDVRPALENSSLNENRKRAPEVRLIKQHIRGLFWKAQETSNKQILNKVAIASDQPYLVSTPPVNGGSEHQANHHIPQSPATSSLPPSDSPSSTSPRELVPVAEFMSQASQIAQDRQICVKFDLQSNPPVSFTFFPPGADSTVDPFLSEGERCRTSQIGGITMSSCYVPTSPAGTNTGENGTDSEVQLEVTTGSGVGNGGEVVSTEQPC